MNATFKPDMLLFGSFYEALIQSLFIIPHSDDLQMMPDAQFRPLSAEGFAVCWLTSGGRTLRSLGCRPLFGVERSQHAPPLSA